MLAKPHSQYPFRLWMLVDEKVPLAQSTEAVFSDPKCMLDQSFRDFRARFSTKPQLASDECRSTLMAIGFLLKLCISRIECRHASIRRLLLLKGSTWLGDLAHASSDFLMMRSRNIEGTTSSFRRAALVDEEQVPCRGGCGGPSRAFISEWLGKESNIDSQGWKDMWAAYREVKQAGGAEWERLKRKGRAGTLSGQQGGNPFGPQAAEEQGTFQAAPGCCRQRRSCER